MIDDIQSITINDDAHIVVRNSRRRVTHSSQDTRYNRLCVLRVDSVCVHVDGCYIVCDDCLTVISVMRVCVCALMCE